MEWSPFYLSSLDILNPSLGSHELLPSHDGHNQSSSIRRSSLCKSFEIFSPLKLLYQYEPKLARVIPKVTNFKINHKTYRQNQ